MDEDMIAVCGLNCGSCDIRKAPSDPESAKGIVAWFRKEGWLKENEGIEDVIEKKDVLQGLQRRPLGTLVSGLLDTEVLYG